MTREKTIDLLAQILAGLRVPSSAGHYHMSVAYEPYQELLIGLGLQVRYAPSEVRAALEKALDQEAQRAAPLPAMQQGTASAPYYYDDNDGS